MQRSRTKVRQRLEQRGSSSKVQGSRLTRISTLNSAYRRAATLILVNGLCLSFAFAASVDTKRSELKELQGRIGALQKELANSEASKADAADGLRDIESSISVVNAKLRELGDKRAAVQAQLNDLEQQSQQLSAQIERQQQQLSRLLYQQFVHGNDDALHLLLAGSDPNQSARERYL